MCKHHVVPEAPRRSPAMLSFLSAFWCPESYHFSLAWGCEMHAPQQKITVLRPLSAAYSPAPCPLRCLRREQVWGRGEMWGLQHKGGERPRGEETQAGKLEARGPRLCLPQSVSRCERAGNWVRQKLDDGRADSRQNLSVKWPISPSSRTGRL